MNIFGQKIRLERWRLDRDGYDTYGRYFGTGLPVFRVWQDDFQTNLFFRARDRKHAIQIMKLEDKSSPSYWEIKSFWSRINAARPNPVSSYELTLITKKSAPLDTLPRVTAILGQRPVASGPRWASWRFGSMSAMEQAIRIVSRSPVESDLDRSLSGQPSTYLHEAVAVFTTTAAANAAAEQLEANVPGLVLGIDRPAADMLLFAVESLAEVREINSILRRSGSNLIVVRWDPRTQGLSGVVSNPLAPQTRNVLLGVAALGALGALFYAINASAKSTTAPGQGGGSLNFLIPTGAIEVGASDSGTTIPVTTGQVVAITVPNADPGYRWTISYAGPNVMGSPKGDSSSGQLVELYTVRGSGQQSILFTQLDSSGNVNPNNGEYTFTFTTTLTPVGGNQSGV